jgi:hypothetical protein
MTKPKTGIPLPAHTLPLKLVMITADVKLETIILCVKILGKKINNYVFYSFS